MEDESKAKAKFESVKEKITRLLKSKYLTENEKKIVEFILYQEETKDERPTESKDILL